MFVLNMYIVSPVGVDYEFEVDKFSSVSDAAASYFRQSRPDETDVEFHSIVEVYEVGNKEDSLALFKCGSNGVEQREYC